MDMTPSLRTDMLQSIPKLRAFALSLCRNSDRADDLVQETLMRACISITQFRPGTSMAPWLTTILRNQYYSEYRKLRREVEDAEGIHASALKSPPAQMPHVECAELKSAIKALPNEMREAIVLVGALGLTYSEAARKSGCAIGTIKSRVHRARSSLAARLHVEDADHGGDPVMHAVVRAS